MVVTRLQSAERLDRRYFGADDNNRLITNITGWLASPAEE